ncbi:MAG: response regulator transcription factor [Bacteroidetes bacterium]|nr:response regulator transcription factor [Bacteroidota bacterium]
MPRILIADDHNLVRAGIKQLLSAHQGYSVNEASTGSEAVKMINESDYDLIILDISMPGRSGLDVLKEIKTRKPQQAVLMLSIYPEEQYAIRSLKAGASGYLTKDIAPEELMNAIEKIMRGEKYVKTSLTEKIIEELSDARKSKLPHERLSDREYEIFCRIGEGKTISEIAQQMFLSVKTVSTYRSRILKKTGLKNNAGIMKYVIENKLAV